MIPTGLKTEIYTDVYIIFYDINSDINNKMIKYNSDTIEECIDEFWDNYPNLNITLGKYKAFRRYFIIMDGVEQLINTTPLELDNSIVLKRMQESKFRKAQKLAKDKENRRIKKEQEEYNLYLKLKEKYE